MSLSKTVVINCAGIGSRLGFGKTKALIEVGGKPIIAWHLAMLKNINDVRIVVGFQAEEVIKTVLSIRKDVTFVFNHEYHSTGTAHSFYLGSRFSNPWVISLDGDLLIDYTDFQHFLAYDGDCLGICKPMTDEPVLVNVTNNNNRLYVTEFSRVQGQYEWTGLLQASADRISLPVEPHVFQLFQKRLPLPAMVVDAMEIDTPKDYDKATSWIKNKELEVV